MKLFKKILLLFFFIRVLIFIWGFFMVSLGVAALAAGIAATGALASSIVSSQSQKNINERNEKSVESANALTREREDNAVQRRVRDLRLAGLSPTLAAGSAASSAAMTAYQQDNNPVDYISNGINDSASTFMNALSTASNIQAQEQQVSQSIAQTALIEEERKSRTLDNEQKAMENLYFGDYLRQRGELNVQQISLLRNQVLGAQLRNSIDKHDFDYFKNQGFSSKGPLTNAGAVYSDASALSRQHKEEMKQTLRLLGVPLNSDGSPIYTNSTDWSPSSGSRNYNYYGGKKWFF